MEMLLRPKQAKSYRDIVQHQALREKVLRKYQSTNKTPLPDDVLVVGYNAMLPNSFQENILNMSHEMETFQEVREYVGAQVRARRTEKEMSFGRMYVTEAANTILAIKPMRAGSTKPWNCWTSKQTKTQQINFWP